MIHRIFSITLLLAIVTPAAAHHPTAGLWLPRVEPWDWLERLEPKNYRERYNRPRYIGGKIAYYIAPSSQEAMSWHEHKHRGSYKNHAGPIFKTYNFPKPWEALRVGPRSDAPMMNPGETIISEKVISTNPAPSTEYGEIGTERVISEQVISDEPIKSSQASRRTRF